MSYIPADKISKGAFRNEVSNELTPQVQLEFPYGFMTAQVITASGNGGETFAASGVAVSRTGDGANGNASLISYRRARHQGGQGLVTFFDGVFSTGVTNSHQLLGVGDENEGIYFGYSGVDFGVLNRSPVGGVTFEAATTWNRDKGDGTGKLPALDFTKGQMYKIEALPSIVGGFVRWSIMDPTDGEWVCVHNRGALNVFDFAIITQLNWATYMDAHNDSNTSNLEIKLGTQGIFLEGKEFNQIINRTLTIDKRFTPKNTEQFAFAYRNKVYADNGVQNRAIVRPQSLTVFNDSIEPLELRFYFGAQASVSGAQWINPGTNSISDYSVSGVLINTLTEPALIIDVPGDDNRTIKFDENVTHIVAGLSGIITTKIAEGDTYSLTYIWEEWI